MRNLPILLAVILSGCGWHLVKVEPQPSHTPHPSMPPKPMPPGVVHLEQQPPSVSLMAAGLTWVTLGWTPSTDTTITSQTLSYGVQSTVYTNNIPLAPTITQFQVTNLVPSTTYFFGVKATAATGLSSVYSTELMYTTTNAPPQPPAPPTNLKVIATP